MTPHQAIQKMNQGYRYALLNLKLNKVINVHREYAPAWNRVKATAYYRTAEKRRREGRPLPSDDFITHDVVSLYDIAFNEGR